MKVKKSDRLLYIVGGLAVLAIATFVVYKVKNKGKGGNFRKNLAKLAEKEHSDWNFGKIKETASSMYDRLVTYWKNVGWGESMWTPTSVPWSAAFISYVMKKAGAGDNFKYSSSHSSYIRDAVKNRKENNANPFKAYRLNEKKVEVGDLVCYARQDGVGYDTTSSYKSHCDIVVSADNNEAKVIGGNVGNSVTKTTVKLNNGFVNDNKKKFFTVIKTT
jgi:hypothetical protein